MANTKTRRAWNNKLDNLNELLSWMFDKDILTKGDKAKKDQCFRRYYRYYNDGDQPRGKAFNGLYTKAEKEAMLEQQVEDFIKYILNKYHGKYDRAQFRADRMVQRLQYVIDLNVSVSSTRYWIKDLKVPVVLVADFEMAAATYGQCVDSTLVAECARSRGLKDETWTHDMERAFLELQIAVTKIRSWATMEQLVWK